MDTSERGMNRWKKEQLESFKAYLRLFDTESREYAIIMRKIEELERGTSS